MGSREYLASVAKRSGDVPLRSFFFASTIRANLLWLLAACVLPGVLATAFLIEYFYQRERAGLEQHLLQTARALAQAVERELAIAGTAAEILSGGPFFVDEDLALAYRRASDLVAMRVGSTMVLGDRSGRQVFNTLEPFGARLPAYGNPEQLRQVFETGRTIISGAFVGAVSRRPVISIAVPIRQRGRVRYVLGVGILPARFEKILTRQHLPAGQIATILDANGALVARSVPSENAGRKTPPDMSRRAREGVVEMATADGIPSYAAFSRLPVSGWMVEIAVPKNDLLAQMRVIVAYLSLGIVLLLIAGIALAFGLGRRIAGSVHALVAPALALGSNQPAAAPRLPIREADEVARAINTASDLIRRRTSERDLACERVRLAQSVFNNAQEAIVVTDLNCRILAVNPAFSVVTEYASDEIIGRPAAVLQSGRHDRSFYQRMWQSIGDSGGWQGAIWNRRKSGDIYQEWLVISAVRDEQGRFTQFIGISMDMSRMNHAETHLEHLAHHDALTGLPNRLLLQSRLEHTLERARRDEARCAVLFLDLDRFKPVNDTWGHAAGDELLRQAVARMRERLRDVDTLARLGGDEFVVVLDSPSGFDEAARVAQELIERLSAPFQLAGGQSVGIGGSVGISLFPEHGDSVGALIEKADVALYQAKQAGRGCWRIHGAPAGGMR